MSSVPMPAPIQPLFGGDKFSYWTSTPALVVAADSTAGDFSTNLPLSTNCPSSSTGWPGTTTNPLIPNWYHCRIVKCVLTVIIQPRNSQVCDDLYVCWRPSAVQGGIPAKTVKPQSLIALDPRWKFKMFRMTADAPIHKFRLVINPHDILPSIDIGNQMFSMPTAVGNSDGTIPIEGTWMHVVFGQNYSDASVYSIPAFTWQAHYKLVCWERLSNAV